MLITNTFNTPVGQLKVTYNEHYIFESMFTKELSSPLIHKNSLTDFIVQELKNYSSNPQHRFLLPLNPEGSVYQKKVWQALLRLQAGDPITYGELARRLSSSPRAIGQACKKNPIALFIPCHRVIGKVNLGGYMGSMEAISYKTDLIFHEKINRIV